MSKQRYESVWDAVEDTPGDAAKTLGVTQPRISDLMRGKIDVFSLDTLVNMLAAAEIRLEMRLKKAA